MSPPRLLPRLFHRNKEHSSILSGWRLRKKKQSQHERKKSVDTDDLTECQETGVEIIRILPDDTRSLISDLSTSSSCDHLMRRQCNPRHLHDNCKKFILPFPDVTTTWYIDILDDHGRKGRIRYGCSHRLLYEGTEVVSTVQDLIEFDGRAVFSLRSTSDIARRIVSASEIMSTLQQDLHGGGLEE